MSFVADSADVAESAKLGEGTKVWHLAQVREDATLGANCIVGRGAYIGTGVQMGDNCKVQNHALVYEPATLADGVFVGPAVVFTNDTYPRAVNPDGSLKSASDWEAVGVTVEQGAAIGARSVCVAPVTIGAWATVAAGAVVTKDVPEGVTMVGIPARAVRGPAIVSAGAREERGFAPYGITPDLPDPVARAIDGLLDRVHSLGARVAELERQLAAQGDRPSLPEAALTNGNGAEERVEASARSER